VRVGSRSTDIEQGGNFAMVTLLGDSLAQHVPPDSSQICWDHRAVRRRPLRGPVCVVAGMAALPRLRWPGLRPR